MATIGRIKRKKLDYNRAVRVARGAASVAARAARAATTPKARWF
jgi:hypothetical protein